MARITKRQRAAYALLSAPLHADTSAMEAVFLAEPPKPKVKAAREEAHLQIAICKYLKTLPGTLYWHCPSSFYRGSSSGPGFFGYIARLKSMGWYAGIPDLAVIFRNAHGATTVCFAELKAKRGATTGGQEAFMDKANGLGCYTAEVRSLDDMRALLRQALHPSLTSS